MCKYISETNIITFNTSHFSQVSVFETRPILLGLGSTTDWRSLAIHGTLLLSYDAISSSDCQTSCMCGSGYYFWLFVCQLFSIKYIKSTKKYNIILENLQKSWNSSVGQSVWLLTTRSEVQALLLAWIYLLFTKIDCLYICTWVVLI